MDETVKALLAGIYAFCRKHDLTKSGFGRQALKDPNFVYDLEIGDRNPTVATVRKVNKFMGTK